MSHNLLHQIQGDGVSVWLDGVTRSQIHSGELAGLIMDLGVSGVTTNPTLFAASLSETSAYGRDLDDLRARRVTPGEAARVLAAQDARLACDVLLPIYERTEAFDGWVSLEVDPSFANDVEATLAEVRALSWLVDRPNLMVKIPATSAGVAAIAAATGEGHNINATLIFSVDRYRQVLGAYTAGIEHARSRGIDISRVHSVASLFVSRVDVALAAQQAALPTGDSKAAETGSSRSAFALPGIANARRAYGAYQDAMATVAWQGMLAAGANPQRLLWASTGVKDPTLDPTTYVSGLAIPGTVNTMPLATLNATAKAASEAIRDGSSPCDTTDLEAGLHQLNAAGDELMQQLLADGIAKFQNSWSSVLANVGQRIEPIHPRGPVAGSPDGSTLFTSVDP